MSTIFNVGKILVGAAVSMGAYHFNASIVSLMIANMIAIILITWGLTGLLNSNAGFRNYSDDTGPLQCPQMFQADDYIDPRLRPKVAPEKSTIWPIDFDSLHYTKSGDKYNKKSYRPELSDRAMCPSMYERIDVANCGRTFADGGTAIVPAGSCSVQNRDGSYKPTAFPIKYDDVNCRSRCASGYEWLDEERQCRRKCPLETDDFGTYCKSRTVVKNGVRSDGPSVSNKNK